MKQQITRSGNKLYRRVQLRSSNEYESWTEDRADADLSAEAAWWQSLLRGSPVTSDSTAGRLTVVDAFCGAGGFALGLKFAAEATGRSIEYSVAIDTDAAALDVYRQNFKCKRVIADSVSCLVDFHVCGMGKSVRFGYRPEVISEVLKKLGRINFFIAGPPCEGHSNLNNHTRRRDPRNELYLTAVALGIGLNSEVILIENVPTVLNSHSGVVDTARRLLLDPATE